MANGQNKRVPANGRTQSVRNPRTGPLADQLSPGPHWDAFLALVRAEVPDAEIDWKTYAGKSGRQCVIRAKDRNLAYLKPDVGWFLASFALSDTAVAGMAESTLPKELVEEVQSAPKYPEGRPARIRVDSAKTLKVAATLLAIKVADVRQAKSRRKK